MQRDSDFRLIKYSELKDVRFDLIKQWEIWSSNLLRQAVLYILIAGLDIIQIGWRRQESSTLLLTTTSTLSTQVLGCTRTLSKVRGMVWRFVYQCGIERRNLSRDTFWPSAGEGDLATRHGPSSWMHFERLNSTHRDCTLTRKKMEDFASSKAMTMRVTMKAFGPLCNTLIMLC